MRSTWDVNVCSQTVPEAAARIETEWMIQASRRGRASRIFLQEAFGSALPVLAFLLFQTSKTFQRGAGSFHPPQLPVDLGQLVVGCGSRGANEIARRRASSNVSFSFPYL